MSQPAPEAKSIFGRAMEIGSPTERAAFLEEACAGHPAVKAEVETLLKALGRAGSFMDSPAAPGEPTGEYESPIAEREGTAIGPYLLREQIGEGGMGLVFVAEQQQPVRRKVALKVIKPGMDTRQVVARFEAERQALALMDHPNIARVLDAGTTQSGRPYFVMELVRGIPITEYCDAKNLSPKDRLGLFVQVCNAVQHAHQKGVIHRDLKPSNILVAPHDGIPVVKVIDFGVAKALGQSLTEKTIYTRFAQMIGTPLYMSPEQAEVNQLDVDTRSDVYSLGVLLYELLTGTTPFDGDRFRKAAFDEIRRILKEEEPPRPSTRLTSLGATLTSVSAKRSTEPGRLAGLVRGELDWIVMRCLEKDRSRRYDSAAGLAKDVQRYLSGDAVEACPPTLGYRLKKLYRRNRAATLTAALVFGVLLAGIVGTSVGLFQARKERIQADFARDQADADRRFANEQQEQAYLARVQAEKNRDHANEKAAALELSQDRTRRLLYASQLHLAQAALNEKNAPRAAQLLDEIRPNPGEKDIRNWEWHYLDRLMRPDRSIQLGPVQDSEQSRALISYSRDGAVVATDRRSGNDGIVFDVWESQTGRLMGQVPAEKGLSEQSLGPPAISTDGKYLLALWFEYPDPDSSGNVASPTQCRVRLFEVATGKELPGPSEPLSSVNTHYDVVVGPGAAWIQWIEVAGGRRPQMLPQPTEIKVARWERSAGAVVRSRPFTPGLGGGTLRLLPDGCGLYWRPDAADGKSIAEPERRFECWNLLPEPRLRFDPIPLKTDSGVRAISADGGVFAIVDQKDALVIRLSDGKLLWRTPAPIDLRPLHNMNVSPDGSRIVFNSRNNDPSGSLVVVERNDAGDAVTREIQTRETPPLMHILSDGRSLLGISGRKMLIWDLARDRDVAVQPVTMNLAPGPRPKSGVPFDLENPPLPKTKKYSSDPVAQRMRSPDGRLIAEWEFVPSPRWDGPGPTKPLKLRDAKGELVGELTPQPDYVVWQVRFLAGGRRLLLESMKYEKREEVWSIADRRWELYDISAKPISVATGTSIVDQVSDRAFNERPGRGGGPIVLRDALSGAVFSRIDLKGDDSRILEFDPTGDSLYVLSIASVDPEKETSTTGRKQPPTTGRIALAKYDVATGAERWSQVVGECFFPRPSGGSLGLSFRDDQAFQVLPGGKRLVVSYSTTDADRLWVGSEDGTRLYDLHLRDRRLSSGFGALRPTRMRAVSSDGNRIAIVVDDEVQVWNLENGARVLSIPSSHRAGAVIPAFSPDGTRLFTRDTVAGKTSSTPTRLRVWDLTLGRELLAIPLSESDRYFYAPSSPLATAFDPSRVPRIVLEDGILTVPVARTSASELGIRRFDGTPVK